MDLKPYEIRKIAEIKESQRKVTAARTRRKRRMNAKLHFFRALCLIIFAALLARVGYIMTVNGEEYKRKVIENQTRRQTARAVNPNRGAILDRNRQNIAVSNIIYNVILDVRLIVSEDERIKKRNETREKKEVIPSEKTFAALSEIMGLDAAELRKLIEYNPDGGLINDTNWYPLGFVNHTEAMLIKDNTDISCVFLFEESERAYVYGAFAPQVIGFTRGGAQWGLEKTYDTYLKGKEGYAYSYGYATDDMQESASPQDGATLVTTLDFHLQQIAQEACDRMYDEFMAQNTSVIIMNPQTGEILAMAASPLFDLNNYDDHSYISSSIIKNNWASYTDKEKSDTWNSLWGNFNTSVTFEPGSIFKPIVVAAALEEGLIRANDSAVYFCGGSKTYSGWPEPIRCHLIVGHGQQTLDQVLSNSCNVAMMQIGEEMLGKNLFYKYQRDFGYGEKTGIDLPAEASAATLIYTLENLLPVQLATSSFGQGFRCTPIQAITSFAALINGGNLLKPYIVSQVVDQNNNIVYENAPTTVRKVISKETSDYMRSALVKVVSEGTGNKAYIEDYNIGGKTGTAQQDIYAEEKYTVSFIAYLPAEHPEIIALVLIDKPAEYIEGRTSAVPASREVLLKIIENRGILPSNPSAAPHLPTARQDTKKLGNYIDMPLADTIASLNALGIHYMIKGDAGSIVSNQFPAEGSDVDAESVVLLYLRPEEGETLVATPDVIGMTIGQAKLVIEACGFVPVIEGDYTEVTTDEETADTEEQTVISQVPDNGIQLPRGIQVLVKLEGTP